MAVVTPGQETDIELVGSWFGVEIDWEGGVTGHFSDVSGLGTEINVVEYSDSMIDTVTRKRPGLTKYSEVTIKRTLSPDRTFWDWCAGIREGKLAYRTNGSIVVYDMGGTELSRWNMTNVWPSKWSASDLDVGTDDLMTEEITLQVELLERVAS